MEIPYPLAPWLNLDLSEIVVIMAISMLGFKSALFVCVCKFFVSILFKGPVGPIAIGQITALIASLTICCVYYYLSRHLKLQKEWQSYAVNMIITMFVFAMVMFILNYLFVTQLI
ncbi:MAG: Gx transporter family protein [Thomasclavelia spiroformis]